VINDPRRTGLRIAPLLAVSTVTVTVAWYIGWTWAAAALIASFIATGVLASIPSAIPDAPLRADDALSAHIARRFPWAGASHGSTKGNTN
jgi:hypothetical protein